MGGQLRPWHSPPPPREVHTESAPVKDRQRAGLGLAAAGAAAGTDPAGSRPQPGPSPSLPPSICLDGRLMEVLVLREMVVNKGIQKPSALPLGKFIHILTVCYFN